MLSTHITSSYHEREKRVLTRFSLENQTPTPTYMQALNFVIEIEIPIFEIKSYRSIKFSGGYGVLAKEEV